MSSDARPAAASSRVADARSFLFVPGTRPDRFEKAAQSGADVVVLDLEDSVPGDAKAAARDAIAARWAGLVVLDTAVAVRINAASSSESRLDLAVLRGLQGLAAVMVPKAESADALAEVRDALGGGVPLLPIVESAAGLQAVQSLAAVRGVLRLAIGDIDFMADTGIACDEQGTELVPLRFAVAVATRSAGLAPAIDGVTVQTGDALRLRNDTLRAKRFGFGAKLCIHPSQVAIVHEALAPTAAEIDWARRVVAADRAALGAAVRLDGRMVDLPVVRQAERLLALAARLGGATP